MLKLFSLNVKSIILKNKKKKRLCAAMEELRGQEPECRHSDRFQLIFVINKHFAST